MINIKDSVLWFVRGAPGRARFSFGPAEASGFPRIDHGLNQSRGSDFQLSCVSLRDHEKRIY
jgi:hypothetical protein